TASRPRRALPAVGSHGATPTAELPHRSRYPRRHTDLALARGAARSHDTGIARSPAAPRDVPLVQPRVGHLPRTCDLQLGACEHVAPPRRALPDPHRLVDALVPPDEPGSGAAATVTPDASRLPLPAACS